MAQILAPRILVLSCGLLAGSLATAAAAAESTERVSVDSAGLQANAGSGAPSISADGRFVAFQSYADDLVVGDTNSVADIFVRDRVTGLTTRVSLDSWGAQATDDCLNPFITPDGRFVAFESLASNLVPGDTNGVQDVFVHDRQSGLTQRASLSTSGAEGNALSGHPTLSSDGSLLVFASMADNLVANDTNSFMDVFVRDLLTGVTIRASVSSSGIQGNFESHRPVIARDGGFVAFGSYATNLVSNDGNNTTDVFVHDLHTGQTSRVSVSSTGTEAQSWSNGPVITPDGRHIAFESEAQNLVAGDLNAVTDCFLHDRLTGTTIRVSVDSTGVEGNGKSQSPAISADGLLVAFPSSADNLDPSDTNGERDVFVHDLQSGLTTRVSVSTAGMQGSGSSTAPSLSADGRIIVFESLARELVPGDTNGKKDVFVHDRFGAGLRLVQTGACPGSITLSISNATPRGKVAIACGPAGSFARTTPPCAGLALGVAPPALVRILTADAAGTAVLNISPAAGACGLSVQAVDVESCTATNVIVL